MRFQAERSEHFLKDIAIHAVHRELRPVYRLSERVTVGANGRDIETDFAIRDGKENLIQAVILRLLTPRGELTPLGHADYGSRIHELIGRENSATNRNLMKLFILEALKLEPRIEKVVELKVEPSPGTRSSVDVWLNIKPVSFSENIEIGPFSIALA